MRILYCLCLVIFSFKLPAQLKSSETEFGTFTDNRDYQTYKTVKIGSQVWMAENLNYDPGEGSWVYNNISSNSKFFGRLYTWELSQKVCPSGWLLPSKEDWMMLTEYLGGHDSAGGRMKGKGTSVWDFPNKGASDDSGFTALPGGYRLHDESFLEIGKNAYFWSSTSTGPYDASGLLLYSDREGCYPISTSKKFSFSVRCKKQLTDNKIH